MDRLQVNKRKRQDLALSVSDSLSNEERIIYNMIHAKGDMGIWQADIKKEINFPVNIFNKCLKSLESKQLVKQVVSIKGKGKKLLMASEFEPSKEITGGDWYAEGSLDIDFIESLKTVCLKFIEKHKVVTIDGLFDIVKRGGFINVGFTSQQLGEILRIMVLDDEILEEKSNGFGDFADVPCGRVCYRLKGKGGGAKEKVKDGAMASIPCGVCPTFNFCTPDGIVSPITCEYYQKWLDF